MHSMRWTSWITRIVSTRYPPLTHCTMHHQPHQSTLSPKRANPPQLEIAQAHCPISQLTCHQCPQHHPPRVVRTGARRLSQRCLARQTWARFHPKTCSISRHQPKPRPLWWTHWINWANRIFPIASPPWAVCLDLMIIILIIWNNLHN